MKPGCRRPCRPGPARVLPNDRKTVGVLFLAGMVVGIGGNILIQPILAAPDHLATASANSLPLAIGAMLICWPACGTPPTGA